MSSPSPSRMLRSSRTRSGAARARARALLRHWRPADEDEGGNRAQQLHQSASEQRVVVHDQHATALVHVSVSSSHHLRHRRHARVGGSEAHAHLVPLGSAGPISISPPMLRALAHDRQPVVVAASAGGAPMPQPSSRTSSSTSPSRAATQRHPGMACRRGAPCSTRSSRTICSTCTSGSG